MQNSVHKQILFLFFLFLILVIVFSFILHTPKDVVPSNLSVYKLFTFLLSFIEEGAFYRAPFKILSSHTISLKRR